MGFNHIAEHMLHEDVLIGGEESGGISFKGHIPMGDGVLMGLLIVEMVADAQVSPWVSWLIRPSGRGWACFL